MKKYFCDITGEEVTQSEYVEVRWHGYHTGKTEKHAVLSDFEIEGFNKELEPELEKIYEAAEQESQKARKVYIEKALATLKMLGSPPSLATKKGSR